MGVGKPCGAVIPLEVTRRSGSREAARRQPRHPPVRGLSLASRPIPTIEATAPPVEYEACPERSEGGVSRSFRAVGDRHGGNLPSFNVV